MDKMRTKVGKDRPQVVYADQLQNITSINQPRDTKQVRNLNYRETKKRKVTSHQHTVADEILQVIDMVDTHEFVQEIVHTKSSVIQMNNCKT
jgi:ribosomal protein S8E